LAPALLGLRLVRDTREGRSGGIIVETEAYGGPADRASHGLHSCLNVVAEIDGVAGAVLIRAVRPVDGLELMKARRGRPGDPDARLAAGPARLCQALGVDRTLDGHDLTRGAGLWLEDPASGERERSRAAGIEAGPRIGVTYAGEDWAERPWRFGLRGDASLSRPFRN
jgi:DNA-3-methyladenine glycosylase